MKEDATIKKEKTSIYIQDKGGRSILKPEE